MWFDFWRIAPWIGRRLGLGVVGSRKDPFTSPEDIVKLKRICWGLEDDAVTVSLPAGSTFSAWVIAFAPNAASWRESVTAPPPGSAGKSGMAGAFLVATWGGT